MANCCELRHRLQCEITHICVAGVHKHRKAHHYACEDVGLLRAEVYRKINGFKKHSSLSIFRINRRGAAYLCAYNLPQDAQQCGVPLLAGRGLHAEEAEALDLHPRVRDAVICVLAADFFACDVRQYAGHVIGGCCKRLWVSRGHVSHQSDHCVKHAKVFVRQQTDEFCGK